MPGTKNIKRGWWLLAAAVGFTLIGFVELLDEGIYGIAVTAFLASLILFAIGLIQRARFNAMSEEDRESFETSQTAKTVLLAMSAACSADGEVDDEQIATMARLFGAVFDVELEESFIRESIEDFIAKDIDLYEEIAEGSALMSQEEIRAAFGCAWYAAASKREIKDEEEAALYRLAAALGMDDEDIQACVDTFAAMAEGASAESSAN